MLIIMEYRDLHALSQHALDHEALGRLDVLEIDGAEGRFERGDYFHQPFRIVLSNLDVEHVNACELLEQCRLAFHDGLARQRTDGAETEHGRAIGDDADQIAASGKADGGRGSAAMACEATATPGE